MPYVYHPPTLTVDIVIFEIVDGELNVLLVKRAAEPFKGEWGLPGAYNAAGDTTMQALEKRVLRSKVGLELNDLALVEQLYAFDAIGRDPRGHAVSITYLGLGYSLKPLPSEPTQEPTFYPVKDLWDLAFDHEDIVPYAHDRLKQLIMSTTAISALLPEVFTLSQLQTTYEAALGTTLDKRNFRKKFLGYGVLESTERYLQDGAHRPALLYRFKERTVQQLNPISA